MNDFFIYIDRNEIGTVWTSGFKLIELCKPHGFYAVLGEFICRK